MNIGKILEVNNYMDSVGEDVSKDAAEVVKLYFSGKSLQEAIKIVKSYYPTNQSKDNSQDIVLNSIIAPGENIDKDGQVYSTETGETLRDLI